LARYALFAYPTLFLSEDHTGALSGTIGMRSIGPPSFSGFTFRYCKKHANRQKTVQAGRIIPKNKKMCRIFGTSEAVDKEGSTALDRKSTRLNSSHVKI